MIRGLSAPGVRAAPKISMPNIVRYAPVGAAAMWPDAGRASARRRGGASRSGGARCGRCRRPRRAPAASVVGGCTRCHCRRHGRVGVPVASLRGCAPAALIVRSLRVPAPPAGAAQLVRGSHTPRVSQCSARSGATRARASWSTSWRSATTSWPAARRAGSPSRNSHVFHARPALALRYSVTH